MPDAIWWSNVDGGLWAGLIVASIPTGLLIWFFLWKREPILHIFGFFRVDDTIDEALRKDATEACKEVAKRSRDVPRLKLQDMMVEAACRGQAIAFSRAYPHKIYEASQFTARCIVTGHIAVVDLWPGPDYTSDGEGIEPINILIDRERRPQHSHALISPEHKADRTDHENPNGGGFKMEPKSTLDLTDKAAMQLIDRDAEAKKAQLAQPARGEVARTQKPESVQLSKTDKPKPTNRRT